MCNQTIDRICENQIIIIYFIIFLTTYVVTFQVPSISWIQYIGVGGLGGEGGWRAKGGVFHTLEQKNIYFVLMEVQKGAQRTFQAEKVIGNNFTTSVALLVFPSSAVYPHS